MSDFLQITCPSCSCKLRVNRPAAQKATIKCTQCGAGFTFKVPPRPAATRPATAKTARQPGRTPAAKPTNPTGSPVAPTPTAAPAVDPFDFGEIPAAPAPGVGQPVGFGTAAAPPPARTAKRGKKTGSAGKSKWLLIAGAATLGLAAILGGGFFLATMLMPGMAGVFDSADAIVATADKRNDEILERLKTLNSETDIAQLTQRLEYLSGDSMQLVIRAAMVSPVSSAKAASWTGVGNGETDEVSFEEKQAISEQLKKLSDSDRMKLQALVMSALRHQQISINYLKNGHLQLPEATTEGERIERERIEILRRVNRLAAGVLKGNEFKEPLAQKSPAEIAAIFDERYGPIHDDVQQAADEMLDLADRRYGLETSDVGDPMKYQSILIHTTIMNAMVLSRTTAFMKQKPKIDEPIQNLSSANSQIDRAARGQMTDRLAAKKQTEDAKEAKKQQAIAAEKERERKANEAKLAAERAEQQAKEKQNQQANDPGPDSMAGNTNPAAGQPGGDNAFGGRAPGGMGGFGPGGPGRGFGSNRFGPPGGSDRQNRMGQNGPGDNSNRGMGRPGSGAGSSSRSGPPSFDPNKSIRIKMSGAKGLDSKTVMQAFKSLKVATSVSVSNGDMTATIGHAGDIQDVANLITFGKIESIDKEARTITVSPE